VNIDTGTYLDWVDQGNPSPGEVPYALPTATASLTPTGTLIDRDPDDGYSSTLRSSISIIRSLL
jgi:hypothetical protein